VANAVTLEASAGRILSPYAVLHLCDGAPRELVEETYWLLVGKLRFGVTSAARELRLLDELNRAYESITRNGHNTEPATERAVTPSVKRWYGGRSKPGPWKLDPFETLFVLPDADEDVIEIAHKVLASHPPSGMNLEEWGETIADAVNKVRDPSWRAKHERASAEDAWSSTRRALEAQADTHGVAETQEQARSRHAAEAEAKRQQAAEVEAEAEARRSAEAEAKAQREAEAQARREAEAEAKAGRDA
jgi:hypothetical protein